MPGSSQHSRLDDLLGRLDNLDESNLAALVQRLARERRLLETVFNTVREGILVIRRNGTIEYANAAAGHLLGFQPQKESDSLWKLLPELARTVEVEAESGKRAQWTGSHTVTRELDLSYPEERTVRLYLVPFIEDDPSTVLDEERSAVIVSDISEARASTEERVENERVESIRNLAAGVAHELGNPLNSLTIHLQLMQRTLEGLPPGPERRKLEKSLRVCSGEVERLDGIITHFLEAVRPRPPDLREVDLVAVLEEVLEVMGEELSNSAIEVVVDVPRKPPIVLGDPGQLKQVYFNLIKNAREAMPGGGEFTVRAKSDDEFVYVQLADTGEGIAEEDVAKVFQPYFSTKEGGHGLGMMIVQRILKAHGGQIGLDSRPGVGTVVTVQLPQKHRRVRMLGD